MPHLDSDHSSDTQEEINVDFDFTDIAENDYFGVLNLVKQVFGENAKKIDIRDVTADILKSNGIVVKVEDSDPYALMSFIPVSLQLQEYFGGSNQTKAHGVLSKYLQDCCWWVNDRLINMPPQLVPNLTRLVLEQSVISQKFIIYYCKMGRYVESPLEQVKRVKKIKMESIEFYFQPEDEVIEKYALDKQDVEFDQQSMSSDAKRTFQEQGFVPFRRILILENTNLKKILEELTSFLQVVN